MTKLNTEIKKLKQLLKTAFDTLPDGSTSDVQYSNFAIGEKVELVNGDGTLSPAPDGDYTNNDGVKYSVKDGLIASIEGEAPIEEEQVEEEQAADPIQTQLDAQAQDIADLKKAIDELKQSFSDEAVKDQNMAEQFSKQLKDLTDSIKVLAKIPAEFSRVNNSNQVKDNKEEKENKLKELAKLLGGK